jgi:hypothetical protein
VKSNATFALDESGVPAGPKRVVVADGTLTAIKWLALALMTLDHCNKYLWGERMQWAFDLGRLAMPFFGFVLAYNLARPGAFANRLHIRVTRRLAFFGGLATPFFLALGGVVSGWWPLNILFTLWLAAFVIYLLEFARIDTAIAAAVLFALGGAVVEFCWYGVAYVVATWCYCRTRGTIAALAAGAALASLVIVNHNLWALAAVPVLVMARQVSVKLPRLGMFFYAYYPAHLAGLLVIRQLMSMH